MIYDDELHEECGVFGVFNSSNAAELTYYGLHALQHRGQEGAGIVTCDGSEFKRIKGLGLVTEVFNEENLRTLTGYNAIGHVRYSTTGASIIENVQPFLFRHHTGDFALAHNGNLVNSKEIKNMLENQGSIFQSTSDTEVLAHLVKKELRQSRLDSIRIALQMIEGAFAIVLLTKDNLYAIRDKHGLRPLSIGKINDTYIVSSESCAFNIAGAEFVRDVLPGEIVTINKNGIFSDRYSAFQHQCMCAMEYIYFARPDSDIEGINVHSFRKLSGRILARKDNVKGDVVVGVPDSSISAAIGYAEESGVPYELGLIKNKYIGRTFIAPSQELREKGVRMKLSPVKTLVDGKVVILIDDSIVRGTTSKKIVLMLKDAGAKEVHVRIASPTITHPCFYGVDTSTYEELICSRLSVDEVCKKIHADSLMFLEEKDLFEISNRKQLCTACFTGKYPTNIYQSLKEANKDGKF